MPQKSEAIPIPAAREQLAEVPRQTLYLRLVFQPIAIRHKTLV